MRWKWMLAAAAAVALFAAVLCGGASASRYDEAAQDLASVGMFRGTARGFELDRTPTRSEAAIMLVRLYGAEDSAKADYAAGKIAHPFTDVSAFTSPYVAYLYANGITKGSSDTTFSAQNPCTLQNYVVFLLRALGYRDGVDFQYRDALAFARDRLLETSDLNADPFLRDHLAELTWRALALNLNDGSSWLLDSLIRDGAIDAATAAPLKAKMEAVRAALGFPVPTGEEVRSGDYVSVDECLRHVTDIRDDNGPMTLTAADATFAKVMAYKELEGYADFAFAWIPPGKEENMVWAIVVETDGSLGGLPHGGSLENVRAALVFDALTGGLLQESYRGRS